MNKEAHTFDEAAELERRFAKIGDYLPAFVMQQFGDMDFNPDKPCRVTFDFVLYEGGVGIDNYDVQVLKAEYDPAHDGETCVCSHPYERHFDGWELDIPHVGCKYCLCSEFTKE